MSSPDDEDVDKDATPGRGQGNGEWLEQQLAEALEEWGYMTERREDIIALEADVIARRKEFRDCPDDYIVAECKDWTNRPIDEETIIRLCLLAFSARAMPVLCHTSYLSDRAWRVAQAYDVLLLRPEDFEYDELPALTIQRPSRTTTTHRQPMYPSQFRAVQTIPTMFKRFGTENVCEAPIYGSAITSPCYVVDRTGHEDYNVTIRR